MLSRARLETPKQLILIYIFKGVAFQYRRDIFLNLGNSSLLGIMSVVLTLSSQLIREGFSALNGHPLIVNHFYPNTFKLSIKHTLLCLINFRLRLIPTLVYGIMHTVLYFLSDLVSYSLGRI